PGAAPADAAAALFEAARIARYEGMELLATTVEPDWQVFEGSYALESDVKLRLSAAAAALTPTADERARLAQHGVAPEQRFHYRYVGAELAWKAAALLPNNHAETARILCTAGTWLKYRDPPAADRFYKALERRNRKLPLGHSADANRWFP